MELHSLILATRSYALLMRVQDEGTKMRAHSGHHLMLAVGILALHIVPHEEPKCVEWEERQRWEGVINRKIWLNNRYSESEPK